MDFQGAINAHVAWKMKLSKYLRNVDRSLEPRTIERDDACELGKWIAGEGKERCGNTPIYASLKAEHARFHKAAADVVRRANTGEKVTDEVVLGASSPFTKASTAVVNTLMELRRTVG